MKKSLIIIGFTALLFSCKKEKKAEDFKASDLTGATTLKGTITKPQATTSPVPASGVSISVKIDNTQLYPNSPTATGSRVYTGTTDANGNYSISVTTVGGNGASALVTVNDFTGIFDPITGTQANFTGTATTMQLITGVTKNYNYNATSTLIGTPIVTGTATVSGTLKAVYFKEGPVGVFTPTSYTLANHLVQLDFDKDPTTQQIKTYNATTDASGNFSFTISTTAAAGYSDAAKLYVVDFPTTQDTILMGGTQVTGKPGYFGNNNLTVPGGPLVPTEIRNAIILNYGAFVPN